MSHDELLCLSQWQEMETDKPQLSFMWNYKIDNMPLPTLKQNC